MKDALGSAESSSVWFPPYYSSGVVGCVENNAASTSGGITGAGFMPGRSGNPGGRPRGLARITRELIGDEGRQIAEFWLATMNDPAVKMSERLEASRLLADRGWGRAPRVEPTVEELTPAPRWTIEELDREIELLACELQDRDRSSPSDAVQ